MTHAQQRTLDYILTRAATDGVKVDVRPPRDIHEGVGLTVRIGHNRETLGIAPDGYALHLGGFESSASVDWAFTTVDGANNRQLGLAL